jgi:uncharacterized protein YndB with AHSA1/START domain
MIRETSSGPAELASVALDIRDGRSTVVFTRDFLDAPDRVWIALTDPEQLALWAPHTADRNLSSVGKVVFTMLGGVDDGTPAFDVPGAVLIADKPTTLEHSWGTDVLDWRLAAVAAVAAVNAVDEAAGSRLTLRHTLSDPEMASAVAAGWHLCLEVADAVLAGKPTSPVRGSEALKHGWQDLNERYAAALGVEPSRIDQP